MGVYIEQAKCIGCQKCSAICPGNIIKMNENGKAFLKRPGDCWRCVSCMKACPVQAIVLSLPLEMGGGRSTLALQRRGKSTAWTVVRENGGKTELVTNTDEANKY